MKTMLTIIILAAAVAASAQTVDTECSISSSGTSASCTSRPDPIQQHIDELNAKRKAQEEQNNEALGQNIANATAGLAAYYSSETRQERHAAKAEKKAAEAKRVAQVAKWKAGEQAEAAEQAAAQAKKAQYAAERAAKWNATSNEQKAATAEQAAKWKLWYGTTPTPILAADSAPVKK